jgi:hypothetical protein
MCRNTDHWPLLVRGKLPLSHWLVITRDIHVIRIERRAQVTLTCLIFYQKDPWTEPQVNPMLSWVYNAVFH